MGRTRLLARLGLVGRSARAARVRGRVRRAEQDRFSVGRVERASLAQLAEQVLDTALGLGHPEVAALEAQIPALGEDLDVEVLTQQLGVPVVRPQDEDGLLVGFQGDRDFSQ